MAATGSNAIRELRREMTARLGEAFDLREFHDVILRDGPVPLELRRERVHAYYAGRRR